MFKLKAQNEISPARRSSQTSQIASEEAEGFICPGCMASFSTPQELEVHYEREHIIESNGAEHGIQKSVQEIQSTLKEEQFYSAELKKEVEKLSQAVQKSTEDKTQAEVDLYQSQVNALSESKDLCKFVYRGQNCLILTLHSFQ